MPNRYQTVTRTWIYRFLALRDGGERCIKCGATPPKTKLTIDHADGNHFNNDPENLSLLCQGCNDLMRKKSPSDHRKSIVKYRAMCVCVKNTQQPGGNTELNKTILDYNQGSVEMRANGLFEARFRDWIMGIIKAQGSYPKREAINAGAEYVGCSTATVTRYLEKMTSDAGILAETLNTLRQTVIVFKSLYPEPTNGNGNGHKDVTIQEYAELVKAGSNGDTSDGD